MDQQSQHFQTFCQKSGVVYNQQNFQRLWDYVKSRFPDSGSEIIPERVFAANFLDIKDQLEFVTPEQAPTTEQLQAERTRRLEANNNIGPLSARSDPRKTDDPIGGSTLKEFIKKAIDNLAKQSRGEVPPSREKPKQFRTIPPDVTPEQLRDGDYSVAEIKDYLTRRNKTPKSKQ